MQAISIFTLSLLLVCSVANAQQDSLTQPQPEEPRISNNRDNHQNLTGKELAAAIFPGFSIAIPNTRTRIGFKGYVKLDYVQDLSGTYDKYEFLLAEKPFKIDPKKIKDIAIYSTVFKGQEFKIK